MHSEIKNRKTKMVKYEIRENAYFGEDDRYWIVRLLERYKYAEVWLADDLQTGLLVAIKVYTNRAENEGIHYEAFEQMPCLLLPNISAVWAPDTDYCVETDMHERPDRQPKKQSKAYFWVSVVITLIIGLCAGFIVGLSGTKENPKLRESINLIEQGDALFSETDRRTWMPSLENFQQAKETIDEHNLQLLLPNMEPRIAQLQIKIEAAETEGIETAKRFYDEGNRDMAINTLENEVLAINPNHAEGNELLSRWLEDEQ